MSLKTALLLLSLIFTQSCASVRHSYKNLLVEDKKTPTIHMKVGETKEALSISDGFPGW